MNDFFRACEAGLTNGWAFFEILIMLFVAVLLGWLLRHFSGAGLLAREDDYEEPMSHDSSDLKVVEGIGPKIEELLKDGGIETWDDLADAKVSTLQDILTKAGSRFQMHNPKTWPEQAEMARDGQWAALREYQDFLLGGN